MTRMRNLTPTTVGIIVSLLVLMAHPHHAFFIFPQQSISPATTTRLRLSEPFDVTNFNPLTHAKNSRLSIRAAQMQQLHSQLLNAADSSAQLRILLEENAEFWLEPLDDDNAVLDPSSVIRAGMDRTERYRVYERSLQERIDCAKGKAVRNVLVALKTFILEHE
jgi:hypothetical protein